MHLGMAAFGAISAPAIGRDITQLRIAEGMEARSVSMPRIISRDGDDIMRVITRSGKRTPFFEADTKTTFDVLKVGDKGFQIGSGTGKTTTRVLDFMKQGVYKPGDDILKSSVEFGLGGKGTIGKGVYKAGQFKIVPDNPVYVTSGEAYVSPDIFQNIKITQKDVPQKFWSALVKNAGKDC